MPRRASGRADAPRAKEPPLHWVIRWVDEQTDRDMAAVIDAPTRAEAESIAQGRGIPFLLVARATRSDIADARATRRSPPRDRDRDRAPGHSAPAAAGKNTYTCLGRPLGRAQLAALLLAGVATALLHLRPLLPAIMS
jgi:hypothetical protein